MMNQSAQKVTVVGEANESDDDESVQQVFAFEVSGEATESEEDEDVLNKNRIGETADNTNTRCHFSNNLLQQKLIESNIAIWKNLTIHVKEVATSSSQELLNTEQLLIKLQVSMQNVLSSLKLTRGNAKQLYEKTNDVLTTHFIPYINLQNN